MNLVVSCSDALRPDPGGCYGARRVRTPTIDELAASGARFDQAIAAAPWTCPSTTSMITGLYPHHHGYLHWDARLDPALPTLFSVAAAHGYATGSFVFDESYLFKGFPDANVAGTSETLDGVVAWLRAHRDEPFVLWFHSWATHMPYDILHAERKEWLAAKTQIIDGIQSDSAAALEELRDAYAGAVERPSEGLLAGFLAELDALGLREGRGSRAAAGASPTDGTPAEPRDRLGDPQRVVAQRDRVAEDGYLAGGLRHQHPGDHVGGGHQAVGGLVVLVHADAIEAHLFCEFELVEIIVISLMPLGWIVELAARRIDPDGSIARLKIIRQIRIRHQVKPMKLHL